MSDRAWPVPAFACDCHMHVFGPPDRYKGSPTRAYTPTERSLDDYEAIAATIGFDRVVFVQPSAYGADNRCMLEVMRQDPKRFRGVAVIDDQTSEAALREMHDLGVRGIRLNLVTEGTPDNAVIQAHVTRAAARIAPLGWHLQIYSAVSVLGALAPVLRGLGVRVVFDHMAGVKSAAGLDQPGLRSVLDMLAEGFAWVKVSGADRVTESSDGFPRAIPYASALIAANPGRAVWGTDWPHLGHHDGPRGEAAMPAIYQELDDLALLAVLRESVPDQPTWNRVLVENPAELYGF